MKLNKILPIASIAGVAAIVTPLVTSCGAKTYSYVFNSSNPAEKWTPKSTTGKHEPWVVADVEGALDLFLDEANKNKEILADNMVYSTLQYLKYEGSLSDYGSADLTIYKIDKKEKRLSLDFKASMSNYDRESNAMIATYNFDIKISSMQFVMGIDQQSKFGMWVFEPKVIAIYDYFRSQEQNKEEQGLRPEVLAYLLSDDKWSCSFNIASRAGLQGKEMYVEYNSRSSVDSLTTMVESVIYQLGWLRFNNLYYLQDVIPE